MAQLVEQLIRNQQVTGSSPVSSSKYKSIKRGNMLNITIDGVAGSGKSTLAKEIAKRLNIAHFNTGNVYRAIACEYMAVFGKKVTDNNVERFASNVDIRVEYQNDQQICLVNNHDYGAKLRTEEISSFVAKVSPYKAIRELVRKIQRDFASTNDCVMEGRDIGRVVLPFATCKLFITASLEERARRRFAQLEEGADYEEVLKELEKRDFDDVNRAEGALIPAENAVIVDSTFMNLEETVDHCLNIINTKK